MRGVVSLAVLALLLVSVPPAFAGAPNTHVDPDAPCYRWPALDYDGDGVFDRMDRCNDTQPGCSVDRWGCSSDADGDGVCDGVDQCPNTPAGTKVNATGCPPDQARAAEPPREVAPPPPAPVPPPPPVSETERQLIERGVLRLERVYFETNSARLLDESRATLDEAGATLEKYPQLEVEVQGHTDTRGSATYNQRLSQSRAESVRAYLLEHFRLDGARLTARGYGESEPETRERNDEELLRNRRVMLKVLNPDALPRGTTVEQR